MLTINPLVAFPMRRETTPHLPWARVHNRIALKEVSSPAATHWPGVHETPSMAAETTGALGETLALELEGTATSATSTATAPANVSASRRVLPCTRPSGMLRRYAFASE
jgi:hypothetical protein